ncbi:MAG: dTMP kinase, partial [Alphaproteobacteria bacterium]|nr:dTMP kinase [Alphaproteobacteria bacterium]
RGDHLRSVIRPRLDAGDWVLSDRFTDSTMAYQGYGHGLGSAAIARLQALVLGDFIPDLTLILDVPVDVGLARATSGRRGEDRYLDMGRTFHENVRQGFLDIAENDPELCILLDGTVSAETLFLRICAALNERFGMKISPV